MNLYSSLLAQAASEVREYRRTAPETEVIGAAWFDSLARRLDLASSLTSRAAVESEVDAIAHAVVDCGLLTKSLAPSFLAVLQSRQRYRKLNGT